MRKHLVIVTNFLIAAVTTSSLAKDIDLRGTWQFTLLAPSTSNQYSGNIEIDGSNMAKASVKTPRGMVTEKGHVDVGKDYIDIIFTSVDDSRHNGPIYNVDQFRCTSQSKDALSCHDITAGEQVHPFVVSRVKQ
jgi:hypothetical protein